MELASRVHQIDGKDIASVVWTLESIHKARNTLEVAERGALLTRDGGGENQSRLQCPHRVCAWKTLLAILSTFRCACFDLLVIVLRKYRSGWRCILTVFTYNNVRGRGRQARDDVKNDTARGIRPSRNSVQVLVKLFVADARRDLVLVPSKKACSGAEALYD
jgi:hypothetical protein